MTGCGVFLRTRPVEDQYSKAPLKQATQQELIDSINAQAESIHSLKATVDIDSSAGGMKKGQVTDYKEIRGYVLAKKPDSLHMIGLMPGGEGGEVRISVNGQEVKTVALTPELMREPDVVVRVPASSLKIGKNEVTTPNISQPMENIRPQNIYEALLIRRIDPKDEIAVLENGYETLHDGKGHRVLQEDYELTVIKKADNGWALERKIIFSRTDLKPHEQFIYSEDGKVATDAKYAEYKDFSGTIFPSRIQIYRPQEEYDITLNMLKVEINTPLKDEQFVLTQPAGAQVVHLDRPQSSLVLAPAPGRQE